MAQGISHGAMSAISTRAASTTEPRATTGRIAGPATPTSPFSRLARPLSQSRIGVVTTADRAPGAAARATKLFAAPNGESGRLFTEKSWDREATHTDDPETYLPLARLAEHVEAGRVGSLSPRFYGVPTDYSQRLTLEQDAPQVEAWMREDGVDIALLVRFDPSATRP